MKVSPYPGLVAQLLKYNYERKNFDGCYFVRSKHSQKDCHQPEVLFFKLFYEPTIKLLFGTTMLWQTLTFRLLKTVGGRKVTTDGFQ